MTTRFNRRQALAAALAAVAAQRAQGADSLVISGKRPMIVPNA
jgi:hypothetical protein